MKLKSFKVEEDAEHEDYEKDKEDKKQYNFQVVKYSNHSMRGVSGKIIISKPNQNFLNSQLHMF